MSELCTNVNTLKYKSPKVEHQFLSYPLLEKGRVHLGPKNPRGDIATAETSPGDGKSGMIDQNSTTGRKK